jgi:hypothetical protein
MYNDTDKGKLKHSQKKKTVPMTPDSAKILHGVA